MSESPDAPVLMAEVVGSTRLPRTEIVCCECGATFSAPACVIPHCMDCERRRKTTHEERLAMRTGGWQAVLRMRRPKTYPTQGRVSAAAAYLTAEPSDAVRQWCEHPVRPLVLTGLVGRGKTWQAVAALRTLTAQREDGWSDLVQAATLGRADSVTIARWSRLIALAIDDLGSRMSDAAIATAGEVIDHRVSHGLPLIVTANLSRRDLAAIDQRIESRLSSGTWLMLDGPDRRVTA